jgi:hypothetical protein
MGIAVDAVVVLWIALVIAGEGRNECVRRAVLLPAVAEAIVPGMIVLKRWLPGGSLGMRIHGREMKSAKVSAPGTGAGDLPVSDAVRGESLGGRPITRMG